MIGRRVENFANPKKRLQVRLALARNIMAVTPRAQSSTASNLGIRESQFLRSRPQLFAQDLHKNMMFLPLSTLSMYVMLLADRTYRSVIRLGISPQGDRAARWNRRVRVGGLNEHSCGADS